MADTKISALTVATTPLAGTEVLPIVQSGVTKQVSVADLTAGRAVSALSLTLTNALTAANGGTGQSSYAVGDLLYASTTTALSKLADVATGNALISGGVGVAPSWGKIGLTTHVSGTLAVGNGGTGLSSVAQGDILYGSAANTLSALAKNTTATRYLSNTGSSNNPDWAQVNLTNGVTGTLPVGNGGTGQTSWTSSGVLYASAATTLATSSALTFDGTNLSQITTGQVIHTIKSSSTSGTRDAILRLSVASNGGSDAAGTILFTYDTAYTQAAKIDSLLTGGGSAGILRFFTSTGEAFRLNESQYMLVGYTSSNGAYKLQVNSQIFATNATIATSDGNYKTNVTPLNDALSLVCKLNPVSFKWKQHPVHNFDCETPTIGFIAQEVKETLKSTGYVDSIVKRNECVIEPEVVENGIIVKEAIKEEFLGLADATLVALLTKAIQELKAEFDAYRSTHP